MRALRIVARGFRNLASLDVSLPPGGGVLLGPNGHGKTNFLELLSYPVLFRSLRGARDVDLVRHDGEGGGFHLSLEATTADREQVLEAAFVRDGRSKRIAVDGVEPERVTDVIGCWLAVVFLPSDLRLVSGGAMERRQYLDRLLSLADRDYLRALRRYRSGLKQRNAALRQH